MSIKKFKNNSKSLIKNPLDLTFYRIRQVKLVSNYNNDPLFPCNEDSISDAVNGIISTLILLTHDGFDKPLYLLKCIKNKKHDHKLHEFLMRKEQKPDELKVSKIDHFSIWNALTGYGPFNETYEYFLKETRVKGWSFDDKKNVAILHIYLNRLSSEDIKKTIFFLDLLSDNYEHEIRRCIGDT